MAGKGGEGGITKNIMKMYKKQMFLWKSQTK